LSLTDFNENVGWVECNEAQQGYPNCVGLRISAQPTGFCFHVFLINAKALVGWAHAFRAHAE